MLANTCFKCHWNIFLSHRSRDYRISAPPLQVWGCVSLWGQDRALPVSFQDRGSLWALTWKIKVCAEPVVYAAALETFSHIARLLLSLSCRFFPLHIFPCKKKNCASFKGCQTAFLVQILLCCVLSPLFPFFFHFVRCFLGISFYLGTVWPAKQRETGLSLWCKTTLWQRMFHNNILASSVSEYMLFGKPVACRGFSRAL